MAAGKPKIQGHFAMIPRDMWLFEARLTLPHYAVILLIALAIQYNGRNNGDLALTWSIARRHGIHSKKQLVVGLRLLLDRGLIVQTREGSGIKPFGCALYAVTWLPIDDLVDKIDLRPTKTASNKWAAWSPGPSGDRGSDKTTGPSGDPIEHLSGPPGDLKPRNRDPRGTPNANSTGPSGVLLYRSDSIQGITPDAAPESAEGSLPGTDPGQLGPEVRHANSESLDSPLEGPWLRNH
jgi:hypothetical protein